MPAESRLQGAQAFEADGATDDPDSEPDLLGVQPTETARCADAHRIELFLHIFAGAGQLGELFSCGISILPGLPSAESVLFLLLGQIGVVPDILDIVVVLEVFDEAVDLHGRLLI